MTPEQKAKAYDEALEKAKQIIVEYDYDEHNNVFMEIFPELKESEDEKIRKELIEHVKDQQSSFISAPDCRDKYEEEKNNKYNAWLDWLEKQEGCECIKKDWLEHIKQSWYKEGFIDGKYSDGTSKEWTKNDAATLKELIDFLENGTAKLQHDLTRYANWLKIQLTPIKKQGESKSAGKMQVSEKLYEHIRNTCACIDDALSSETLADVKDYLSQANYDAQSAFDMIEKQGEQKSADEVEPRFHEGEWITNGDYTWKIVEVKPLVYILQSQDGNIVDDTIFHVNEQFHSFTIKDAKDGDVLASELCDSIILFRGIKDNNVDFYCDYDFSKIDIPGDRFSINDGQHYGDVEDSKDFHPATKEQCDTFFTKMKEDGYEWDDEKKKVKKIEDEEYDDEDYGIDGLWHAQRILEKTLGKVSGYQTDDGILSHKCAITAVKKLDGQKPAWSEEDEHRINRISDFIWKNRKGDTDEIHQQEQDVNWLKSLKNKVQPQPKQEWSEEDEKMLHNIENCVHRCVIVIGTVDKVRYIDWLKSIKERIGGNV